MTGFPQGFVLPNRNASGWDSDLNANFALIDRGYVIPLIVGTATVNTGQLVDVVSMGVNSYGVANIFDSQKGVNLDTLPQGVALQAGSPGNTIYALQQGTLIGFAAWSGQLTGNGYIYSSVVTPGWVSNCADLAGFAFVGRAVGQGRYIFNPQFRVPGPFTRTVSGIAHCASGALGVFSFALTTGLSGWNTLTRARSNSCDNYRLTFFSNSGRSTIIYDTVINSGNLGVRTIDMIDAAIWPYSLGASDYPVWGTLHGALEVLSSAATAINSQAFQVNFGGIRHQ